MSDAVALYQAIGHITDPEERGRMAGLRAACARVREAKRGATVDAMRAEAASMGMAFETMRTIYYRWARLGDLALADGRKAARATPGSLWQVVYQRYCERDLNTSRNAWRVMMGDFRTGTVGGSMGDYADVWRGVGTWREVWARERPRDAVPAEYPSGWVPVGASYPTLQNRMRLDPDSMFALAATRQGRRAAHRFLIDVIKTRVGLPVGAARQWDDVWHNTDVRHPQIQGVVQPLEFAGYDVASAYKCDSVIKPRFARIDGKRDNLKEQTFRFVFAHSHCVTGFHRDGILNGVEHGTAAIRPDVRKQIALIPHYGPLIRFQDSGILGEQVHAGLFAGCGGGNFRIKALCESQHGVLHNRTAALQGSRGRDAERMHESRGALVRYEERLIAAAAKLPADVAAMIEYGLLSFDEYTAAFRTIERELMRDPEHSLEGWDSNQVQEYSIADAPTDADWHNARDLLDMDQDQARAIAAFLQAHPTHVRQRYMSRQEVWHAGQSGLIHAPLMEMPAFLDSRDAIELRVRDNGTVDFSNGYFYGRDKMIYRVDGVRTPAGFVARFAPGDRLVAKYNPLCPDQIWLLDRDSGKTLGMAPLHTRAPMMDQAAIEASLGLQSHDLARKIMPVRGRHQQEAEDRAGRMGRNQAALTGLAKCLPVDNATVSDDGAPERGEFWSDEETETVGFLQEITTDKE